MKYAIATAFVISTAYAAPPAKVMVCHFGEEIVVDENGDIVLDENGEAVTQETAKVINISERAVDKHLANHGDFVIESIGDVELCAVDEPEEAPGT